MASGIWTSTSGAAVQAQNVDMIANNLANGDTLAFKKDLPTFKEYLASVEREKEGVDVPHGQVKDKDFYPIDGKDQSFVILDGTYTNFRQGHLRVTQGALDVAMDGPGFLEVSTPNGARYTRQGSLKLAADGRLVTTDGHPVLAAAPANTAVGAAAPVQGAPDAARFINLRDIGKRVSITPEGELYAGDELIARLNVVEFQNLNGLRKAAGQLFLNKDPANVVAPQRTQVRQGMLETSNVNPVEEMTNLIRANRLFEHDLKAMKTMGDLMGREVNDIGKL